MDSTVIIGFLLGLIVTLISRKPTCNCDYCEYEDEWDSKHMDEVHQMD